MGDVPNRTSPYVHIISEASTAVSAYQAPMTVTTRKE